MSFDRFANVVSRASLSPNDRVWFKRRLGRYRQFCGVGPREVIPTDRDHVIAFLREQKSKGRQAWQRLQAVKAVELYGLAVLKQPTTDFHDIRQTLAGAARRQRQAGQRLGDEQVIDVVGHIDPHEHEVIQKLRCELRLMHRAYSTEKQYVKWTKQLLQRFDIRDFGGMPDRGRSGNHHVLDGTRRAKERDGQHAEPGFQCAALPVQERSRA